MRLSNSYIDRERSYIDGWTGEKAQGMKSYTGLEALWNRVWEMWST